MACLAYPTTLPFVVPLHFRTRNPPQESPEWYRLWVPISQEFRIFTKKPATPPFIILHSSTCYDNATFTSKKYYQILFAFASENRGNKFSLSILSISQLSMEPLCWSGSQRIPLGSWQWIYFRKFQGILQPIILHVQMHQGE